MKLIMLLLAMAATAILTFYLITGTLSPQKQTSALEKASTEAGVPGGVVGSGQEVKERVEGILKKSEEEQKKLLEEAAP